jgi:trehalose 6-phosphate phosphatase
LVLGALQPLTERPDASAVLVDFDGSLAPIVPDPGAARPLPAAREVLAALVGCVARVGVVSGRPAAFLAGALGVDGMIYVGHYGLERYENGGVVADPRVEPWVGAVAAAAEAAERELPGVRIERKGTVSVALHWRGRPELAGATRGWAARVAGDTGLELHPGRMVVELRPPVAVDKGTVVEALCDGLVAAAFAGDDAGDLAAFAALDRLHARGQLAHAVRIAVRSPEEPAALVAAGDVHVDGPAGLVRLLHELATAIRPEPA